MEFLCFFLHELEDEFVPGPGSRYLSDGVVNGESWTYHVFSFLRRSPESCGQTDVVEI
jgi:hypothetical protein